MFDGAISYLMVLQVRMVLRKELFLRGFLMYNIDDLSIALSSSKYGCTFGGCSVNHLSYADDRFMASRTGKKRAYLRHGWAHTAPSNSDNLDDDGGGRVGVCVRARERVCVRSMYMRECVMCLPYTIILFDPGW